MSATASVFGLSLSFPKTSGGRLVAAKESLGKQWSDEDRQRFADRNVLKAKTVPAKKKPAPKKEEWD